MFTIKNSNGISANFINTGATLVSLQVPDRKGKFDDVTLGYNNFDLYKENPSYFGCIVGRYGNRIANGEFQIDNKKYKLTINNNGNHLHGGITGLSSRVWKEEIINDSSIKFSYISPDREQGYPGTLSINVVYSITNENGLKIEIEAITDSPTILNPTNHSYFNLFGSGTILDHKIFIDSEKYTPIDEKLIPTGELLNVENTPFDLRVEKEVSLNIPMDNPQISRANGFDHNWVLNNFDGNVRKVATVYEEKSGRFMEIFTDQPGIQFYSGNYLEEPNGKKGAYVKHSGFCLETQHFPDSPNKANFPSTILQPGEKYYYSTEYRFSVK